MKFGMDIVHMSKTIQVPQDEKRLVGFPKRRQNTKLSVGYTVCRLQQKGEAAVNLSQTSFMLVLVDRATK